MVHKIHSTLPYVLVNYIFFLAKILYIQNIWRNNRPKKVCYCKKIEFKDCKQYISVFKWRTRLQLSHGDRVLLLWKKSPIAGIKQRKAYGTIDRMGQNWGQNYYCRIRLVSHSIYPKRVFYYINSPSVWSPNKLIILEPWKSKEFHAYQVNGLFGYFIY
jgi:hypothetical protein